MKKFLLATIAAATMLSPAAQAMQVAQADVSAQDAPPPNRGEGRRGWGRGPSQDQPPVQGQGGWQRSDDYRRGRDGNARRDRPRWESGNRDDREWRGEERDGRGSVRDGWQDRQGGDGRYEGRREDDRRDNDRRWEGRVDNDRRWDDRRDDDRRWGERRYDRGDYRDRDRWDRNWRSDRRYDWRGHRNRYGSSYRPGRYYAPDRYHSYRRFGIGLSIGRSFYSNRYWIADPWQYRLPDARGPYRWVRYYDDVLLVDVRSGYVVDAIYGFFW